MGGSAFANFYDAKINPPKGNIPAVNVNTKAAWRSLLKRVFGRE
jgi:hypothetical protein